MKKRLDLILYEKGYFDSREKAKREIMLANVIVNEQTITKAGTMLKEENIKSIRIKEKLKYVSRGGLKLEGAIKSFNINFKDMIVLDIGASTGGFTDCAIKNGAKYVYSVDVGTNQLAYSLRVDARVKSIENTHINSLDINLLDQGLADIVVADVSFISLTKISNYVSMYSKENSTALLLIKPQFEVGKEKIGKNGIVVNEQDRQEAIKKVINAFKEINYEILGVDISPIKGTKGNIEYLLYIRKGKNEE